MCDRPPRADFVVESLRPEQVHVVYPLIRAADPGISLREWVRYAQPLATQQPANRGILVATRATQRHPSGAVCYRSDRGIARGLLLTAEHFVAMELLSPQPIIIALLRSLDQVAAALHCDRLRFIVPPDNHHVLQALRETSYSIEAVTLHRAVKTPAGAAD